MVAASAVESFRIRKLDVQIAGDQKREKGALVQGATDRIDVVCGKPLAQLRDRWPQVVGPKTELLEIEPQIAVVSRLEPEVSLS